MTRNSLARMDLDTHWLYHRKWRQLQREYPAEWPTIAVAWLALLAEAWSNLSRQVTLEDAWPVALEASQLGLARTALTRVRLLDRAGKIPQDTWDEWIGPTVKRMNAGARAAAIRWGNPTDSGGNATAMPIASQPASQPARNARKAQRGGNGAAKPMPLGEAMAAMGFDPEKYPDGAPRKVKAD